MPLPESLLMLLAPAAYPHPVAAVRLIETHISWVLIAGDHAYKIKKPVDLGFLDFSTLEKRRFCCEEEIRLNRRLAPDTYLDVVPVTDTGIGGAGKAREWAVRMRAFPADATLDREADITPEQIDAIADRVARFHGEAALAPDGSEYGSAEAVMYPVRENLRQIAALLPAPEGRGENIVRLEAWSEREYRRLQAHFAERKAKGFIRECHGDLHLGNIAWVDGAPLIFDCIEFNPGLRYVDVISEVAFLFMDLVARGKQALAWRFLNRYLEHTGDYGGLAALRFYLVYRAMVRAKVACIRTCQGNAGSCQEVTHYLDLAGRLGQPGQPGLLLMHGLSGSGKTWLSQRLLERLGALRLRSDVERKRLYNLHALADSKDTVGDIYTAEASRRTFAHLKALASLLLLEGHVVIVDATFLGRAMRTDFIALVAKNRLPWYIVSVEADTGVLRARVSQRRAEATDASEAGIAVLESQIRNQEPLTATETEHQLVYRAGDDVDAMARRLGQALPAR